jgi:hypothetical protein
MEGSQSLLHELLKRFLQYFAVLVASIPVGLIYLLMLKVIAQPLALIITVPFAVRLAYLAWVFVDSRLGIKEERYDIEQFVDVDTVIRHRSAVKVANEWEHRVMPISDRAEDKGLYIFPTILTFFRLEF